ncbi:RRQRL motif-containing zinc-binding protein [Micromonospora sp. RB23]
MDNLAERTGIRVEFYDPLGTRYGFPTFPYHCAPTGLATLRQLRAAGLRPGGHDPVAQIYWRHRSNRRVAYLYRTDLAKTKRTATPAQREAIAKALLARRTCGVCGQVKPYYIPRRYGCCLDCHGGH